jgi:trigger factor
MSVTVEKLENSMAKLTVEVSAEDFGKAIEKAYQKEKNRISIPGFRKGKAPRKIVEKMYGAAIFYEDAANRCINESYEAAAKESGEDIVSNPKIEVTQIEEGKSFIYTAEVAVKPPVSLGKYKGVSVTKQEPVEATDEEVENELKRQQDANGKIEDVTDRPVAGGDMIKLDFAGSVDGVAFDGGTATDYDLTVGSHSFIPGFEEQLVGMNIGEEKDVEVTFPEDYHEESLAGKPAVFHCKVNSIKSKVLPDLNDAFADEVSEFSTLEEYKADIRKNIEARKAEEQKNAKQSEAVAAAVEDAKIDIPEAMLRTQQENLASEFAQNMQYQGMQLEMYLQYTGQTREQFLEQLKPQAEQRIRNSLVLEAIADAENIEVTEEDLEKEYQKLADRYHAPLENVKKIFEADEMKEDMKKDVRIGKAADFVTENAKETKKAKAAKEEDGEEKPKKTRKTAAKKKEEAAEAAE